jgi:hypothetical protein
MTKQEFLHTLEKLDFGNPNLGLSCIFSIDGIEYDGRIDGYYNFIDLQSNIPSGPVSLIFSAKDLYFIIKEYLYVDGDETFLKIDYIKHKPKTLYDLKLGDIIDNKKVRYEVVGNVTSYKHNPLYCLKNTNSAKYFKDFLSSEELTQLQFKIIYD